FHFREGGPGGLGHLTCPSPGLDSLPSLVRVGAGSRSSTMPTRSIGGMRVRSSAPSWGPVGWILWYGFWIILSLGCLGLGVANYFQERAFLSKAELDTGTITRYELHVRTDGKSEYCPRIEFTDSQGEPVAVAGSDCPNAPVKSKIGTTVQVYYDPANPEA